MEPKPFGLALRVVILDEQGRCLLLRRSSANKSYVGAWEWPGGKNDPGETFDATARREAKEETGLEIELTGVAGAFYMEMPQARVVTLCLEARKTGGALALSEEHDQFAWAPVPDLLQRNLSPAFRGFAEEYIARVTKEDKR